MKWVLIVTWVSTYNYSISTGIETSTWPTLEECYSVGKAAKAEFENLFTTANTANFSCRPSTGREPACGASDMEPCK